MNNLRIEYTGDNVGNGQTFSKDESVFLLNLNRDIVGFTGNYKEVGDEEYSLETFIYKTPDFYERINIECDSKIFLEENPDKVIELLNILLKEFWIKGWVHGDLDSSNIVIQYKDDEIFFRIFDFEEIEYETPVNSVEFFKFIWSDIRKFMKEYLELELVRNIKSKKCGWLYKKKFFTTDTNIEYRLCNIIDMKLDKNINFSKNIKEILNFLDKFSVYKYLYDFMNKDIGNFEVVHDKMILSKDSNNI